MVVVGKVDSGELNGCGVVDGVVGLEVGCVEEVVHAPNIMLGEEFGSAMF